MQIVQVPADGLRDGDLGDDEFIGCAQESLSIDILPCMTRRAPPFYPSHTDLLQKRKQPSNPPVASS